MNDSHQRNLLILFSIILLVVNQVLLTTLHEHFSPEPIKNVLKRAAEDKPRKPRYMIRTKVCGDCEAIKSYLNELNDPSLKPIGDLVEAFEASLARELSIDEIEEDDEYVY